MPEPINLGSGLGVGYLNDANTDLKNLYDDDPNITTAHEMDDSSTGSPLGAVPVGKRLVIYNMTYQKEAGAASGGIFYIQAYSGGVSVRNVFKMYAEDFGGTSRDSSLKTFPLGLTFNAGESVYVLHPDAVYINMVGVLSTT